MKTIETFNTWQGLFYMTAGLFVLYWAIKLLYLILQRFSGRNLFVKRGLHFSQRLLLFFKPIAFLSVVLDFIAINYLVHGMFLIIVGAFAYTPIRNYIGGLVLRLNPLIANGSMITIGGLAGEVKRLLPLGMVVSVESGERFFGYTAIDELGFTINSNDTGLHRHTLFLKSPYSKEALLDILFDNPLLNFYDPPAVRLGDAPDILKLQYTLEKGARSEDLTAFLTEHEIEFSLTQNIDQ